MAKLYTVEKILYFANQPKRLHVSPSEFTRFTDLGIGVSRLLEQGALSKCGQDDSGSYYEVTPQGLVKLLRLQISWRKENGKPTNREEQLLAEALSHA